MSSELVAATEKALMDIKLKLGTTEERAKGLQKQWEEALSELNDYQSEAERLNNALLVLQGKDITPDATTKAAEIDTSSELVDVENMTPEEFEAYNKKEARKRDKPTGPYADIPCKSCGTVGSYTDAVRTMKGKPVKIISCTKCGSVVLPGQ